MGKILAYARSMAMRARNKDMNKEEAKQIALDMERKISSEMQPEQVLELAQAGSRETVLGPSGTTYNVVVDAFEEDMDDEEGFRFFVYVDDGGVSSFKPVTRQFFVSTGPSQEI